ncbi:UbiA prenyltransferase family-domain-containing protein [Bombardia bombarda]|uniref:Protoheme IX farnesyltransferase, mitochondrial n=1 Tax=Bombardia bombarda TaxID=252184 RepID=A0AA40C9I9_9PEZI|nr:UbiA prenyltransferase family-domain-containing protein [Bombardia bombarda]
MRPPISVTRLSVLDDVYWQCTRRQLRQSASHQNPSSGPLGSLSLPLPQRARRFHSSSKKLSSPPSFSLSSPSRPPFTQQFFGAGFFVSNAHLGPRSRANGPQDARGLRSSTVAPSPPTANTTTSSSSSSQAAAAADTPLLPHRRRQAARRNAAAALAQSEAAAATTATTDTTHLPPDASSVLASVAARHPADSLRRKLSALLSLSKPRLTVLVVLSAMVPYAMYPVPAFLSSSALADAALPSLSPLTLLFLTTGTTLCSAAANALNMLYEPDTDSKMSRTRSRPLVRKLLTTRAAVLFAAGCGVVGTAGLFFGVNPTVAFLGAANIALYAGAYTPLKRISAVNTATADGGWRELLFANDGSSAGGWLFAALLFAWQFSHFMPLSWGIREEYKAAGLRMLCWVNPARNRRVALRYSVVFVPLCVALCAVGVTEWSFAVTSLPVNVWLVREAVKFWRLEGHSGSARGLFWASVWHLPVVMVLALAQKKGMWSRVWRSVAGQPLLDDEEEDGEWEDDVEAASVLISGSS